MKPIRETKTAFKAAVVAALLLIAAAAFTLIYAKSAKAMLTNPAPPARVPDDTTAFVCGYMHGIKDTALKIGSTPPPNLIPPACSIYLENAVEHGFKTLVTP